jgi:hypothetical protein
MTSGLKMAAACFSVTLVSTYSPHGVTTQPEDNIDNIIQIFRLK